MFGTISCPEAVMPRLITKLEHLGCKPDDGSYRKLLTAYSFNLDVGPHSISFWLSLFSRLRRSIWTCRGRTKQHSFCSLC